MPVVVSSTKTLPYLFAPNDATFHQALNADLQNLGNSVTVSVKSYGAKGDGSTDDTAAIQAAINDMVNGSNLVAPNSLYFPSGNYLVTSSLSIVGNNIFSIHGDGGFASTITFAPSGSSNLFNISYAGGFAGGPFFITDLACYGAGNVNANTAFNLNNVQDPVFRGVYIQQFQTGIVLVQAFAPIVNSCVITGCPNWGIAAPDNSLAGGMIVQNHFFGNGTNGGAAIGVETSLTGSSTSGLCIVGNDIEGNNGGIQMWNAGPVAIIGNDFDHNTAYHFFFPSGQTSGNVTVMSNYLGPCANVQIAHVQGFRFENNTLFNYSQTYDTTTATEIKQGYNSFTGTGSVTSAACAFSTLPSASAAHEGETFPVSDSTTDTNGAIITGGGSFHVQAYCDGTNWLVASGTGSGGTLPGAWSNYTPTISSSAGAFTTVSTAGRFITFGKTIHFEASVTITSNGTASGGINLGLPATANANFIFVGQEIGLTGFAAVGLVQAAGTSASVVKYDDSTLCASGNIIVISGTFEST